MSSDRAPKSARLAGDEASSGRTIVWFRNDLRLHDHEVLASAAKDPSREIVPVYCFDPRHFGSLRQTGLKKTAVFRARFLLESVQDLKESLKAIGSDLAVFCGKPEDVLPTLLHPSKHTLIQAHREVMTEERHVDTALGRAIVATGRAGEVTLKLDIWGSTLYHLDDLPMDVSAVPDGFTPFKNKVESRSAVRQVIRPPGTLPPLPSDIAAMLDGKSLPGLADLGYSADDILRAAGDKRGVMAFAGGETAALARVREYIWTENCLKDYFDTRNGMLGANYSSKFSPWLAHGCLSPRLIYNECKKYEKQRVENKSTYWLVFELTWRDFYRFLTMKYGARTFYPGGMHGVEMPWRHDMELFQKWTQGLTGMPLVDANMRELAATGFMSNRGRQNVASYLVLDLGIDWRWGAEWFESLLLDHDVASNWGNWNAAAGLTGGRVNKFNIVKQSKDYDLKAEYLRHWCPELCEVPTSHVHDPSAMPSAMQEQIGLVVGRDYPMPIHRTLTPLSFAAAKTSGVGAAGYIGGKGSGKGYGGRGGRGGGGSGYGGRGGNKANRTGKSDRRLNAADRGRIPTEPGLDPDY